MTVDARGRRFEFLSRARSIFALIFCQNTTGRIHGYSPGVTKIFKGGVPSVSPWRRDGRVWRDPTKRAKRREGRKEEKEKSERKKF